MSKRQSLNVLIKPTNGCNLRCKYCFSNEYSADKLEIKDFERFVKLASKHYNLSIVWHGGEPTLWGYKNFQQANEIIKKYSKRAQIIQCVQSNCVHIDDNLIDFFIENNISIGSSFDGVTNEQTRGCTEKYLSTIEKLKNKGLNVGAICVITKQNINSLVDNYNYFKERNQSLNLRPMINSGEALKNVDIFSVDIEQYIKNLKELLHIWFYDTNCNIKVQPFETYLNMLIYKKASVCCYNSCITKWMCLEPNGDITPCNRWFPEEYKYGNIREIKSIKQVFKSNGLKNLLVKAIERREKCKSDCEYFDVCNGGCNNEAFVNGDIANNNMPSCQVLKAIIGEFKDVIANVKDINQVNNKIREKIKQYIDKQELNVH